MSDDDSTAAPHSMKLPYHPRIEADAMTYSVAEVAFALRVSPSTVYRYKDRGLRLIQVGGEGGHTGVRHADLLAYLDACPALPMRPRRRPRGLLRSSP